MIDNPVVIITQQEGGDTVQRIVWPSLLARQQWRVHVPGLGKRELVMRESV